MYRRVRFSDSWHVMQSNARMRRRTTYRYMRLSRDAEQCNDEKKDNVQVHETLT